MIAFKKLLLPLAILPLIATVTLITQSAVKSEKPLLKNQPITKVMQIPTLNKCFDQVDKNQAEAAKKCFTSEFKTAWENKNFIAFNTSLTAQIRANAKAFQPCHDAGHEAGYLLLEQGMINESVIATALNKENACDNGFIHGLFDGVGNKKGITETNWWELAKGCNDLPELQQRNLCGDGSGHGAFQLTHNIQSALTLCSKHTDSATSATCMQGVFMQIVRQDHDQNYPPVIKPSELESKWFDLCKSLARENLNEDFAYNCEIILSKLLSHRMIAATLNWGKDGGIHNQKIVAYLKQAAPNAVNQCNKFSQAIKEICQNDLANMSIYISQMQEELKNIYCQNLPKNLLPRCLSAKP
jgi:hypothetical protein